MLERACHGPIHGRLPTVNSGESYQQGLGIGRPRPPAAAQKSL